MDKKEEKKSNVGIIIAIVIIVIIAICSLWFYLFNDKSKTTRGSSDTAVVEETTEEEEVELESEEGVLTQIVDSEGNPKQTDFVIDGMILLGNRHEYDLGDSEAKSAIEKFADDGYRVEGINSSFYLNEYIEFYIYTGYEGNEDDIKILAVPHKSLKEYEEMSYEQLKEIADSQGFALDYHKPDIEKYRYVGENYVNQDYPEGKYDILFTYKGKLAYYLPIIETKEPKK